MYLDGSSLSVEGVDLDGSSESVERLDWGGASLREQGAECDSTSVTAEDVDRRSSERKRCNLATARSLCL